MARYRHFCETHEFLAESFPNINVDFGPGSLAGYVGSNIVFSDETVWFEKCVDDWESFPEIQFNPENKWWKKHYQLVQDIRKLADEDFYIGMPDLMENIDVLASLRGTQDMIFDMMDERSHCLFLMFPEMSTEQANRLLEHADKYWSNVEGTFQA